VTLFKDDDPETAFAIGRDITAWIELGYRPANVLMPLDIPGLPHARYRRAAEDMEGRILRWASRRRGMSAERDILSMFVNGPDETGAPLSEDRLAGHILTIYAASFTSSVASLIWSLFLLMQHPGIAHDLCDELEGSGLDPAADGMRILDLPLLDRVLKESMRLLTPVPYQVRRVTREVHAAGADLRPRDIVVIGSWATNRLACVYPEAERFRPERWATADANSFDYLTFSAGPRRCLGYGLAMIMVKITLATILARRRPSLVANARIDTKVAVTLRSRRPIPVVMAGRDARFLRSDVRGTITDLYAR
jgi:cytochrome P450